MFASGYSRFASLIPARSACSRTRGAPALAYALGTARKARRRYYPSRKNAAYA